MVRVLLSGSRNIMKFNSSRDSTHTLIRALPIASKKYLPSLNGIDFGSSLNFQRYNVIHSFNRIPLTKKPWVVTFEGRLPSVAGSGSSIITKMLRERLLSDNCQKIIAMSDYCKRIFIKQNKDYDHLDKLLEKLAVIHPNIVVKNTEPKKYGKNQKLQLVFVGNAFVRKGGISILRLAKKAREKGLPVVFHLVSQMKYGDRVYTDYPDASRYREDLELMNLDNVVFHQKLLNQEVLDLLSQSHFQIMPTLHDTYGFSIIEGFSVATPAITSNVCALPEIVHPHKNGYLLEIEVDENGNWRKKPFQRGTQEHWEILDRTYNILADRALELLQEFFTHPEDYERLSAGALDRALEVHDSRKSGELLDRLYSTIANKSV